ncbi:MAG: recombination protein RecR [Lentisphaerae bacterium]|jgi:recombination protein RecR|nr:recombination protein RecR [Lentisphaerota bacterium]
MEPPLDNLIRVLSRLPGLGRRSAERAALALVRRPTGLLQELLAALEHARATVCCCDVCGGFTVRDANPCPLCTDPRRDAATICVVEEPGDILAIERAGVFTGRYHALHGKVSAARATGPADLRLQALAERVAREPVTEIILAVSTDLEGDATAAYVQELLRGGRPVRVTRLAFGLPVDSGVGYSDPLTLKRALGGRQEA